MAPNPLCCYLARFGLQDISPEIPACHLMRSGKRVEGLPVADRQPGNLAIEFPLETFPALEALSGTEIKFGRLAISQIGDQHQQS